MEEKNGKTILNIKELSEYLNCSISTIRKLIYNNDIPYFRIMSTYYFCKNLIDKWIISKHNDIEIGGMEYDIDRSSTKI